MRGEGRRRYSQFSLEDWPRVADVRAADFNGDGKPDLVVGAFGWRKVGHVSVLENRTAKYPQVEFHPHVLDPRPGAVHVIPVDLNGDGHMDIVALIAQQYETVMAYINTGKDFVFTPHEIYTAPHPNWGSSGIELVDLDGDGDLDVLFTHGDTFDDSLIKPYHGLMWLENRGTYPFTPHPLADLPGAFRAEAADMDGDGDLDIVACAFIAGRRGWRRRVGHAGARVARAGEARRVRAPHARAARTASRHAAPRRHGRRRRHRHRRRHLHDRERGRTLGGGLGEPYAEVGRGSSSCGEGQARAGQGARAVLFWVRVRLAAGLRLRARHVVMGGVPEQRRQFLTQNKGVSSLTTCDCGARAGVTERAYETVKNAVLVCCSCVSVTVTRSS
jgi:hypothetical protein